MANEGRSRRAEGPGSNKPAKPAARAGHRRGMFDLDPEQQARLLLFSAVGLVIAIAAGFLVFGYWYSVVKPRNRTVLQVADQKVSYEAMKRRMAYEFLINPSYQSTQGLQILPEIAFQNQLNELTYITQAGPKLGITYTQEDVDKKVREKIVVAADADQRQFADALRAALDKTGLSEAQYRAVAVAQLLDAKIREKFKADAPAAASQAKVAVIQTATEDAANQALLRVNTGEDFSEVAKTVSAEANAATTGGVHEYATQDGLSPAYRDHAFSADIGAVSGVISAVADVSSDTPATVPVFYIVKVMDRSEQPLTETQRTKIATDRLPEWLKTTQDELRANGSLKDDWDDKSRADALVSIAPSVSAKLAAQRRADEESQQAAENLRATTIANLTASPQAQSTAAPSTPAADVTPTDPSQGATSPVAPAQPVAPGGDGQ